MQNNLIDAIENAKPEEIYGCIVRAFGQLRTGEELEELKQLRTLRGYGLTYSGYQSEKDKEDSENYERFMANIAATHVNLNGSLSAYSNNFENIPEDEMDLDDRFNFGTTTPGITDIYRIDMSDVEFHLVDSEGNPMLSSYKARLLARTIFGTFYLLECHWSKLNYLSH